MHSIRIKHLIDGIYTVSYEDSDRLYVLGVFLTSDISWFGRNLIKKDLELQNGYYIGNLCHTERDGKFVTIRHLYDDSLHEIKILYNKLVMLLDEWQKIFEHLPEMVIITLDDNNNFKLQTIEKIKE